MKNIFVKEIFLFFIALSLGCSGPMSIRPFARGGINSAMANTYLIVDESRINGQVNLVEYQRPDTVSERQILRDVIFFNVTNNGNFLYKSRNEGWRRGHLSQADATVPLDSVPEGVIYGALSPDATMVLWVTESDTQSRMVVYNLQTESEQEVVAKHGVISVPTWSPQSDAVAFYFVEPEALLTDAFTLQLVDLGNGGVLVKQLAPPSKQTGLTAARTQAPQWSPAGDRILFLANYEPGDLIRSYAYIVSRDGGEFKRVEGGGWSADGQQFWIVRRTVLPFGDFVLSRYNLLDQESFDIDLPFPLPKSVASGRWRVDGKLFAFITRDNELTFIDLDERRKFKGGNFDEGAELTWLEME